MEFIPGCRDNSTYVNQCDALFKKTKNKNNMIISMVVEKAFEKIQYLLIKTLSKLGIEEMYLSIIKPTANIIPNSKKLMAFLKD